MSERGGRRTELLLALLVAVVALGPTASAATVMTHPFNVGASADGSCLLDPGAWSGCDYEVTAWVECDGQYSQCKPGGVRV